MKQMLLTQQFQQPGLTSYSLMLKQTKHIWEPLLRIHQMAKIRKGESYSTCDTIFPIDLFYAKSNSSQIDGWQIGKRVCKNTVAHDKKIRSILLTNPEIPCAVGRNLNQGKYEALVKVRILFVCYLRQQYNLITFSFVHPIRSP